MPKKATTKSAKARAWKAFSEYVRRKAADEHGYVECVTCGCKRLWNDGMDAGHFISRRHTATFLDETCVHPQCKRCNVILSGNMIEYYRFMRDMYGEDYIDELMARSRETCRYRISDWLGFEREYKEKLNELD